MALGGNFGRHENASFLLSEGSYPGVCLCIWISAMMHHVHTGEAVVTRPKIDIFWACHHEAYSALNGELGMDTR